MPGEMTSDFAQLLQEAKLDLVRRRVLFEGANEHEHFLLSEVDRLKAELEHVKVQYALMKGMGKALEASQAQVAQLRSVLDAIVNKDWWIPLNQRDELDRGRAALAATEPAKNRNPIGQTSPDSTTDLQIASLRQSVPPCPECGSTSPIEHFYHPPEPGGES